MLNTPLCFEMQSHDIEIGKSCLSSVSKVFFKKIKSKFLEYAKKNIHSGKKFNPLSANLTKWSNGLKQFVDKIPTNCLSVIGYFVKLSLKGLSKVILAALL